MVALSISLNRFCQKHKIMYLRECLYGLYISTLPIAMWLMYRHLSLFDLVSSFLCIFHIEATSYITQILFCLFHKSSMNTSYSFSKVEYFSHTYMPTNKQRWTLQNVKVILNHIQFNIFASTIFLTKHALSSLLIIISMLQFSTLGLWQYQFIKYFVTSKNTSNK